MPVARPPFSQTDLRTIACLIHREFAPLFDSDRSSRTGRPLTRQELRDISDQISREFSPTRDSRPSELTLLSVSPKRLHAYWRISDDRIDSPLAHDGNKRLILRLYQQPTSPPPTTSLAAAASEQAEWLDIIVDSLQGQTDIALPESLPAGYSYRAAVGPVDDHGRFHARLRSETIQSIALPVGNPLASLSSVLAALMTPSMLPTSSFAKSESGQGSLAIS